MKKILLVLLVAGAIIYTSCKSKKNTAAFYDYEVECMGGGTDGTQFIKVWGYGSNPDIAIEQAKKNAVHALIFKGITTGKPGCMQKPLATQVGAEQQYKEYFDSFFSKEGKYLNFVSISNDGSINPNDRLKVGNKYKIGVAVSVKHASLRKELEAAGIVNRLDNGF
ncbi:MAG: hypothetical protein ACOYMA_09430 [Bacteroidia bacterium]